MRITGGEYRGRILESPKNSAIRPTSDKVRLAIFNILSPRGMIDGANVIDAFCGTGALGLESLSRGAAGCVFIDSAKASLDLAKKNAESLKVKDLLSFLLKDSSKLGARPDNIPPATLVFLDPPYNKNLIPLSIQSLQNGGWLTDHAHILAESEAGLDLAIPGAEILLQRDYGDTQVVLLKL